VPDIEGNHRSPLFSSVREIRVNRRQFLKGAGGLILAFSLSEGIDALIRTPNARANGAAQPVNAWINVGTDESITVLIGGSELGQGIYTGLAQAVAEELKVDWNRVRTLPCPAAQAWGTGGSSGIRRHYDTMRKAGATAREMLIAAAAAKWGVSPMACRAANGSVVNTSTNASLTYGALAATAATMPVPDNPPLTAPADFSIIGKPLARTDIPEKTDGSTRYALDIRPPGLVYATIVRSPVVGASLAATPATPPDAIALVPVDDGLAVVADNTWKAIQIARKLDIKWRLPNGLADIDTSVFATRAAGLLSDGPVNTLDSNGDVESGLAGAAKTIDAVYTLPYLAHTCMEVPNCTASVTASSCQVWAPTQAPPRVLETAAQITGLPQSSITVTPTMVGGGFGRKSDMDYIAQAIRVAKVVGKPVNLTWTREEDIAHDRYRPMTLVRVRAGVDTSGNIVAWSYRTIGESGGASEHDYKLGSWKIEAAGFPSPVRTGPWRSVGNSIHCFARESAIDELAQAANVDPLTFRRNLFGNNVRNVAVLDAAAKLGNWGMPLPAGHARGFALSTAFGSTTAQVAEISAPSPNTIRVQKVACVIDCGVAVNPDAIEAQMQGGIVMGLSAALWGQVPFRNGQPTVSNFHNYRLAKLADTPVTSVQILQSGDFLGGVGEAGVPPIAPAIANAYASLTGKRLRTLPLCGVPG
jgi:isoquinoline 1-oxidoreductase beta subunit